MMEQVCEQCGDDDVVEDRKQGYLVCNVSAGCPAMHLSYDVSY